MQILKREQSETLKTDFNNIVSPNQKYFTIRQVYEQCKKSEEKYHSVFSYKNYNFKRIKIFLFDKTKKEINLHPKPSVGLKKTSQWYKPNLKEK